MDHLLDAGWTLRVETSPIPDRNLWVPNRADVYRGNAIEDHPGTPPPAPTRIPRTHAPSPSPSPGAPPLPPPPPHTRSARGALLAPARPCGRHPTLMRGKRADRPYRLSARRSAGAHDASSSGSEAGTGPRETAIAEVAVDTTYNVLKFLHVAAVIVWVGGIVALTIVNARLGRHGDRDALTALARQTEFFGRAVIGPAAAVVLIAGIIMVAHAGIDFGAFWITWGFIGFFGFFLIGAIFIRRTGAELSQLAPSAQPGDPRVTTLERRIAVLTTINLLLMFSVVWVMVFKTTL